MLRRLLLLFAVLLVVSVAAAFLLLPRLLASDFVRRSVEEQIAAYLGQPVSIGGASASVFPRAALDLSNVRIGAGPSIDIARLRFVTGLRPLLSRRIEDAELSIIKGRVPLPLPFPLSRQGAAGPAVDDSAQVAIVSIRAIEIRDLMLASGGQEWFIQAAGAVNGDEIRFDQVSIAANATRIHASGALSSVAAMRGQFSARAEILDLDEVLGFAAGMSGVARSVATPASTAPALDIVLQVTAPVGRFSGRVFRNLTTTATIKGGRIRLAPISLAAFGGSFAGRADVDTAAAAPAFDISGRVDALDVPEVMQAAGAQGGVTGKLSGELKMVGAGTDWPALVRTARGSADAAITNGTMPHLALVRPIVLAFGRPAGAPPEGSGSSFSRLGGTFAIDRGTVSTGNLTMAARDFDVRGEARLELASGGLTARGDVALSRELTEQAGVDLRRYAQEDGRVIVPATVSGTLEDPRVSLDVAAATRRALGNELKRRTKSLLDDVFRRR